jgi:hypothetical protein
LENRLKDTVDDFARVTGYNLAGLLIRSADFASSDYPRILSYFTGKSDISSQSFNKLKSLIYDFDNVTEIFEAQESYFSNMRYWDLIERISNIKTFLKTVKNSNRWLRTSVVNASYGSFTTEERQLKKNETIEDIERLDVGSSNPQDSWINTAIKNNSTEESLTQGSVLNIDLTSVSKSFSITNTVDSIQGKSAYGKDIKSKIGFSDNDVEYLDFEETMSQTVNILLSLTRGENYFYPSVGVSKSNIGVDRANFSFPSLFREMSESISTDDSIQGFEIIDIRYDQDAIFYDVKVTTILDKFLSNKIKITS